MTLDEAALMLRTIHGNAPHREQMLYVHLLGIMYADELEGLSVSEIVKLSGLGKIDPELSSGRKLAPHVTLNDATRRRVLRLLGRD